LEINVNESFHPTYLIHADDEVIPTLKSIFDNLEKYHLQDGVSAAQINLEDGKTEKIIGALYVTLLNRDLGIDDLANTIIDNMGNNLVLVVHTKDSYLLTNQPQS